MNTPFTKEQVKNLPKGLNLTRKVMYLDKTTGQPVCYPNRKMRRDSIYRGFVKTNNRKPTDGRLYTKQFVPMFIDKLGKRVKGMIEEAGEYIYNKLVGFRTLIHKKFYLTINYVS